MNDSTIENDTPEISKSQRKRDAHQLLDVAKQLVSMPEARLRKMPLEQDLREAVNFARSIRAHGARKRQLLTVGKMLRNGDPGALLEAIGSLDQKNRTQIAQHHRIEAWRDRLIAGGDKALAELLEQYPEANAQVLRQFIRNAVREEKLGKPPSAARKLFKVLRESNASKLLPPLPSIPTRS